jgi:hypothetical protein
MMNLVYSLIAFSCLAASSAVKPLYNSCSVATVTIYIATVTTYIATAATSSARTNSSMGTNSTAAHSPIAIYTWQGLGCKLLMVEYFYV